MAPAGLPLLCACSRPRAPRRSSRPGRCTEVFPYTGRPGVIYATAADGGRPTAHPQTWVLHLDRSVYALTVNLSGCPPVEQISHPKSTCPTLARVGTYP